MLYSLNKQQVVKIHTVKMSNHQQIEITKKFLKHRLKTDHTTFFGHSYEFNQVKELITRTVEHGESNSVLIIGPPSCGKTTVSKLKIHLQI